MVDNSSSLDEGGRHRYRDVIARSIEMVGISAISSQCSCQGVQRGHFPLLGDIICMELFLAIRRYTEKSDLASSRLDYLL